MACFSLNAPQVCRKPLSVPNSMWSSAVFAFYGKVENIISFNSCFLKKYLDFRAVCFLFMPFFQRACATAPFLCAPTDDVYLRQASVTRKMTAETAQMRKTATLMNASIDASVAVLRTARTYWWGTRLVSSHIDNEQSLNMTLLSFFNQV